MYLISRYLMIRRDKKERRTRKTLRSIAKQKKKENRNDLVTRSRANNFYRWRASAWIIADRSNFEHNVRVVYLRYARPSVAIRGRTTRASRINMHRATVDNGSDNSLNRWMLIRPIDISIFSFSSLISIEDISRRNF